MQIKTFPSTTQVAEYVARQIADQIIKKPDSVLYLATGQTMIPVYTELVQVYQTSDLSFKKITVCNLDEYIGLDPEDPNSFHTFMHKHLFDSIDIDHDHIFYTDGSVSNPYAEAEAYLEVLQKFGPADLCLLGLGQNGHIGFNEPSSSFELKTRVVDLTESTRKANSDAFDGKIDKVPKQAITMGISEIMQSKQILLVATGEQKLEILRKIKKSSTTEEIPATVLKSHKHAELVTDQKF